MTEGNGATIASDSYSAAQPNLWISGALVGWMCVILFHLIILTLQWKSARSLTEGATSFTKPEILKEVDDLRVQMGLKKPIGVYESCEITSPLVVGVFRPRILLPPNFEEGLTRSERKMAFAHELAHLRRHDLIIGLLPAATAILFFFHLLVWLVRRCWRNHIYAFGATSDFRSIKRRIQMLNSIRSLTRRQLIAGILLLAVPGSAAVLPWKLTSTEVRQEASAPVESKITPTIQANSFANPVKSGVAKTLPSQQNGTLALDVRQEVAYSSPGETGELTLQETLDRLGYTVNVPTTYDGRGVLTYNNYRTSSLDDSLSAETFFGNGKVSFQLASQQAYLVQNTVFGLIDGNGKPFPI